MKELILCPECGSVELATIDTSTVPWWTYIHDCENCGYTIVESEWDALPAISVRQPWAYLVCAGLKPIENRTWKLPEKYKGKRVLIHAGAKPDNRWLAGGAYDVLNRDQVNCVYEKGFNSQVFDERMKYSAVIGSVEIVDCVQNHPSIWAEKSKMLYDGLSPDRYDKIYNWVLANPVLFKEPILNVNGKLGFWDFPMTENEFMKLSGWVKLDCMVCGKEFIGPEPKMCCSGRDCGCMGIPIDPVVCSDQCYKKLVSR